MKKKNGCQYCTGDAIIFEVTSLDNYMLAYGVSITSKSATYTTEGVFIDRGLLRLVDLGDCQCIEHGAQVEINFCPFCGRDVAGDAIFPREAK